VLELNQIQRIALLFLVAQALGVFVGVSLTVFEQTAAVPEISQMNIAPPGGSDSPVTSLLFLGSMMMGAVFILLLLKYYKGALLFRLLESVTLFAASNIVFLVLFAWPLYQYGEAGTSAAIVGAFFASLLFTAAKFFLPALRNPAAVVASAGVGAVFGFSLDFFPAVLFAFGLSVYDFIAVFWTRHMVYMARELAGKNLAFSIAASEPGPKKAAGKEGKGKRSTLELGTGDIVVPILLAVSAYRISFNLLDSAAIIAGSLAGLMLVLWYVSTRRTFLPALPPLTTAALASLVIARGIAMMFAGW